MSIDSLVLSVSSVDREARTIKIGPHSSAEGRSGDPLLEAEEEETSLSGSIIAESYVVLEPIGRGGMGRVYEVEHARTGRRLAMKVLAPKMAKSRDVVRRFLREGTAISKLHCTNTVQVFDFGFSDGLAYIVMELVRGATLSKLLREDGPMQPARAMKLVLDVCAALREAHEKGIVHRDIKPDNVMIVRDANGTETAKVFDFGLAKVFFADGIDLVSSAGTVMGTPQYMSPEQIRGGSVDARSDVYSVGLLLYRMITGHRPFSGNMSAVLSCHLTRTPARPEKRAPEAGISDELSDLIMMALAKDPTDRFQSVEALANALTIALERTIAACSIAPESHELEVAVEEAPDVGSEISDYERGLEQRGRGATWVFVVALLAGIAACATFIECMR
jgi:serine/threonine protein kinase